MAGLAVTASFASMLLIIAARVCVMRVRQRRERERTRKAAAVIKLANRRSEVRRWHMAEAARKADRAGAWWKYAAEVATSCTMEKGKFNDPQCAKAALTGAGLDAAKVEACVGDVDEDRAPDVLEENYDAQVREGREREARGGRGGIS